MVRTIAQDVVGSLQDKAAELKIESLNTLVEAAPSSNPSHAHILDKINAGILRLTLIIGPARVGTTATERLVYTRLGFDGNYNQPGLLGRKPEFVKDEDRENYYWDRLLQKVKKLEEAGYATGRDFKNDPLTIVVKETCNIVLPNTETTLWTETKPDVIALVRSPFLQLESRLGCILLRIEDAALAKLGVDATQIDPRSFEIGGERLIKEGTDFTHIDFSDSAVLPQWVQHQKHMKRTRDYSSLDRGFVRLCTLHPIFEDPKAQHIIWGQYMEEHPDIVNQEMIDAHVGTLLEDFQFLPWGLALALFEWDISWTPFDKMFQACSDQDRVKIVTDFSDVQFDAGQGLLEAAREHLQCTPSQAGTYDFDLCSDGEGWDQWYLKSCDWDCMKATEDILPQTRGPVPPSAFPPEVAAIIPAACEKYMRVRSHPSLVGKSSHQEDSKDRFSAALSHCDPTFAYIRCGQGGDAKDETSANIKSALRSAHPALETYFDALDAAVSKLKLI